MSMHFDGRLSEDLLADATTWRRHLHQHPELLFDVHQTAAFVAEKLRAFGCDEVATGLGRTGVVGIIEGSGGDGPTIGLRADMDALPISEETNLAWSSRTPGKMHACGHDGHTTMLLGAARRLCETRNFKGRVAVIFQPAEEGGGGGREMVNDGMMDRFAIAQVFGMHNLPGLPVGAFAIRPGPIMASTDEFRVTIEGRGGHAAMPHKTIDPVLIAAQVITGLQTIAARNTDPLESVVVSVTQIRAGHAHNVIPETATLSGTVRTLTPTTRDMAETRIRDIATGIARAHSAGADIWYDRNYPVTVNDPDETAFCSDVAASLVGEANLDRNTPPTMGGEDFSYMLEARPGAFIFIGNGETASLHHPAYDFNDAVLPLGIAYWIALVEKRLGV